MWPGSVIDSPGFCVELCFPGELGEPEDAEEEEEEGEGGCQSFQR